MPAAMSPRARSPNTGLGRSDGFALGARSRFERILEIEEPRHLVSTVIRGIPVRDYRAEVTLTPTAEDTRIRWAATWGKTLVGRIVRRKLRSFYPDMMALLVAAADRDA